MAKKKNVKMGGGYTYRCGKKIALGKRPDQFVIRKLPDELPTEMAEAEQMSSASARVTCDPKHLEKMMSDARSLAPTHHAYVLEETGDEFLIIIDIPVTQFCRNR